MWADKGITPLNGLRRTLYDAKIVVVFLGPQWSANFCKVYCGSVDYKDRDAKCTICIFLIMIIGSVINFCVISFQIEEFVALTDPRLSLLSGDEQEAMSYDERLQHKITNFR